MRRAFSVLLTAFVACGDIAPDCPAPDAAVHDASIDSMVDGGSDVMIDAPHDDADVATSICPPRTHFGSKSVAYQIDIAHSGAQSGDTLTLPLCRRWSKKLLGKASYPLIAEGVAYVTGTVSEGAATLYALDLDTGTSVWGPISIGSTGGVGLAYDSGKLFAVIAGAIVVAYDATTGALLWMTPLNYPSSSSSAVAANGVIYLSVDWGIGSVYGLDESTGAILWTHPQNGGGASPSIVGSTLFDALGCGEAFALALIDGGVGWHDSPTCNGGVAYTSPVFDGGMYLRSAHAGSLLDALTGQVVDVFTSDMIPAFSSGLALYVSNHVLNAVDLSTRQTKWTYGSTVAVPPVTVGGMIVVGETAGAVVVLDQDGKVLSTDNVGATIGFTSFDVVGVAAADGALVVPADDTVVAY